MLQIFENFSGRQCQHRQAMHVQGVSARASPRPRACGFPSWAWQTVPPYPSALACRPHPMAEVGGFLVSWEKGRPEGWDRVPVRAASALRARGPDLDLKDPREKQQKARDLGMTGSGDWGAPGNPASRKESVPAARHPVPQRQRHWLLPQQGLASVHARIAHARDHTGRGQRRLRLGVVAPV